MTRRIVFIAAPMAPAEEWERHEVEHYGEWLKGKYGAKLPPYAVLYHGHVAPDRNVTPKDEAGIQKLFALEGDLYVVEYPQYGYGVYVAYAIYALILIAVMVQARKDLPAIPGNRNRNITSGNNDLSGRTNKARPNARIPDIYGEVISVPDLLAKTYSVFRNHEEYEFSYMCVGRGEFVVSEVRDDTTFITDIDGASARFFGPDTSPNFGEPFLTLGAPIDEPVLSVVRTEAVNGQVLVPPNDDVFTTPLKFQWPGRVVAPDGSGIDFTTLYIVGDVIDLSGSWFWGYDFIYFFNTILNGSGGTGTIDVQADGTITGLTATYTNGDNTFPFNMAGRWLQIVGAGLDGIYPVASDDGSGTVVLADPELVNPAWSALSGTVQITPTSVTDVNLYSGEVSMTGEYTISEVTETYITLEDAPLENPNWAYTYVSGGTGTAPFSPPNSTANITLALDGGIDNWVGPFDVQLEDMDSFIANFVASNGMYADDGTTQTARTVVIEIEYTPIDLEGSPLGAALTYRRTVQGSAITTQRRALTVRPNNVLFATPAGRFRARRLTPKDTVFAGQIVDEVQWKDLYATASVPLDHFGNVTTVQAVTRATSNALSVKNRKLNLRAVRKLPILSEIDTAPFYEFSEDLQPTRDAADILASICLDPKMGARPVSEVNLVNLRQTSDAIAEYFNRGSPRFFNYTFDDDNVSFEEIVNTVADAVFCTAYRRGNVINLHFERTVEDASLIFNHRNKVPRTEKRSISWGTQGGYDGIEYEYVDRRDGSMQTLYLPADQSAVKAKSISSVGVMGVTQASLHANRAWNKIRFQRVGVEFTATRQGELLQRNMPILVSNNVRSKTQDGEVRGKTGLVLTLSQPVTFEPGVDYVIFLQAYDATVQSMAVYPADDDDPYHVEIEEEPDLPLSIDPENAVQAAYFIVPDTQTEPTMFLVSDRSYESPMTSKVTAMNYDERYYAFDTHYAGRIAHYSELPLDTALVYDAATEEERDAQAFYAEADGTIPDNDSPAYNYAENADDGEI